MVRGDFGREFQLQKAEMLESKSPYVSYAKAGLPASPVEVKKNEESNLIFTSHVERGVNIDFPKSHIKSVHKVEESGDSIYI
ncbi:hypothetical protein WR25_22974 [Diploscapter pachys]|uniref:Uncharacterized protein n=1 Tax=Diploscapter pachys TaxID=2018661 RepID=A0A2A2JM30_9BILA|nr:hypothetical protein WR25_22974 [Diploscapter pachys]